MILAVDAGNSRTKWALFAADGVPLRRGAADNSDLAPFAEALRALPPPRQAVVACVAGEAVAGQLRAALAGLACPVTWAAATPQACGVVNGYAVPGQLGVDRWAALLAARQLQRGPCIVVLAGTALTVDALSARGEFIGGLIVPGAQLMRAALAAGTAAVAPPPGQYADFPRCTADAVHSGIVAALAAAVERQCRLLEERESVAPACLLSGGDAPLLGAALARPATLVEDMVLQGLYVMGNA